MNAYINQKELKNNLTSHLKGLEEEQTKPKISRRKKITKIRMEVNEIETKKTIEKTDETKRWGFFAKIKLISL